MLPGRELTMTSQSIQLNSARLSQALRPSRPLIALPAWSMALTLFRQRAAFLLTALYLFFEYIRPQSIYPALDVLPLPKITLFLAVLMVILEGRLRFEAKALWLGIVTFTLIMIASAMQEQVPGTAWANKDVWINWLLMMLLVGGGIRTKTEFILLLLTWFLWNTKMSQYGARHWALNGFSFDSFGVSGGPGWFYNSGEFGIEMCIFLPLLGYFLFGSWPELSRSRRLLGLGVIGSILLSVMASSSRGAFLGVVVVSAWVALRSPYRLRATAIALVAVPMIWSFLPEGNKARWRNAGEDKDSVARLTYWKHGIEIANNFPILGIGYANWIPYYHRNYNPKGELPHNYLVEAGSQMGYTGLAALVVLTGLYFRESSRIRRRLGPRSSTPDRVLWATTYGLDGAMIGFLASGFFVSVLFYPFYWMNMALMMALARVTATTGPRPRSWQGRLRGAAR